MTGQTLSHYRIIEKLGEGGMGVVYKAKDTHLDRFVAIKILPAEKVTDPERKRRFVQEAKAASALNHPNIITIYDISADAGTDYIVMEYVDGQPLGRLIAGRQVPVDEALDYAVQIAGALATAHAAGIVHRDVKPANIMVVESPSGTRRAKIVDFGLAKLTEPATPDQTVSTQTFGPQTEAGVVLGTVAYMSPEQAEGKPVDARSDIFSFGSLLYEMLAGRRPFQGDSNLSTRMAIVREAPPPLKRERKHLPTGLERIVNRCLEKDRDARYASAADLSKELTGLESALAAQRVRLGSVLRNPRWAVTILVLVAAVAVVVGWFSARNSRIRWAQAVARPEIARLTEEGRTCAAMRLMQQAERYLPGDPGLEGIRQHLTRRLSIRTNPAGADFYIRDYLDVAEDAEWTHLGRTPLESVVIPTGVIPYKITRPGFESAEGTVTGLPLLEVTLVVEGTSRSGMIRIPPQQPNFVSLVLADPDRNLSLDEFWLDRTEVTNRQFKEFADRGGYEKRDYWRHPFVKEGRVIPWEEAVAGFRDATGRPGPATWEFGTYLQGQADYPVSGVSWHEAAAYAEFAGKSLPTVHHWRSAAASGDFAIILQLSNFSGKGPAPVGSHRGLSPYGNLDMAGNVREWCWNAAGRNRYILGGAWSDPTYLFYLPDVRDPMDRSPANGFRCASYASPPSKELTGVVPLLIRDRRGDKPIGDAVFRVYQAVHQYDRSDLKSALESTDDTHPYWRLEKVSFQAASGNERVSGYLYLPKNAAPPYQTAVYFPGAYCLDVKSRPTWEFLRLEFVIRSGRALMYPTYQGTYDRTLGGSFGVYVRQPSVWRRMAIEWAQDLGRSLDYLMTRSDIDRDKLAYYGNSMGAAEGPRLMALEPRLKAGLLLYGGSYQRGWPAEVDPLHFAPRVRAPILMVDGKDDFYFPKETSQVPLFRLLGTPEEDKRHLVVDGGHAPWTQEIIREMLAWLDRYLGPVKTR